MRKVWVTSEPFPTSAKTLAQANAAGASEIVHGLDGLPDGYHEIAEPEPPAPATIKASQARVALHRAGLLPSVTALVDNPATDAEIKIFWEYEVDLNRDSPALNLMAGALGLTQEQLDDLFRTAVGIAV